MPDAPKTYGLSPGTIALLRLLGKEIPAVGNAFPTPTGGGQPGAPGASQGNLFTSLVTQYGLGTALAVMRLIDPNASGFSKGLTGAQLGAEAAGVGSKVLAGTAPQLASTLGSVANIAGPALSLAALGYNLTDIAKSDRSNKQKVGAGVDAGVATAIPVYGLSRAANAVVQAMEHSGSPEVRGAGRAIGAPALPAESFINVLRGDQSPAAASDAMIHGFRKDPVLGSVWGAMADTFGLGTKPTTGTTYRKGLQVEGKNLELPLANLDAYNSPKTPMDQQAYDASHILASILGRGSPGFNQNSQAYTEQGANLLYANYPDIAARLPDILKKIMANQKPAAPQATPMPAANTIAGQVASVTKPIRKK